MCMNGGKMHRAHSAATSESGVSRSTTPISVLPTGPVDKALSRNEASAHAAVMSLIDGCPECVLNTEAPHLAGRVNDAWRCAYHCADCGHTWTTDWRD